MHRLFLSILVITIVTAVKPKSRHVYSLSDSPTRTVRPSGNVTIITSKEFPILRRLSIRHLILTPSGVREPHWHANANELTYCTNGSALVTIFGNSGEHASFIVNEGEMFFVPSGYLHHIENVKSTPAEFIVAFSNELPEDFGLSSAFGAMTNAVLGNTFQLPATAWKGVLERGNETVVGTKATESNGQSDQHMYLYPNKFKFDVEKITPQLKVSEGSAKKATKQYWPVLEDISMFSLRFLTTGMREPHWHPQTAEMGYVLHGRARMTILSPDSKNPLDTYTLHPGDVYFIPRAYPHHIENIGDDEVKFLVFFDQAIPGDIGFTGSFSAYSKEVLAATFQCPLSRLPDAPFYPEDLLIVKRISCLFVILVPVRMASSEVPSSSFNRPSCRYKIRERLFTLGNSFKIKDEFGFDKYTIRSKMWTIGKKLILEDMLGNPLLKIRQKPSPFLSQFSIISASDGQTGQQIASIRQKFTFFKHTYHIYSIYGEYKLKGLDVFDHAFTLKNKDDQTVAIVNKKFFSLADTYGIEMIDSNNGKHPEDHAFILALVIVLHCSLYCS